MKTVGIVCLFFLFNPVRQASAASLTQLVEMTKRGEFSVQTASAERLAEFLGDISEAAYVELLAVPQRGLSRHKKEIENIITLRKWLQQTEHPLAYFLALELQRGVDIALVKTLSENEKAKHQGQTQPVPFDAALFERLLRDNSLEEQKVAAYLLTLNGKIVQYCREQNYTADTLLQGGCLSGMPPKIHVYRQGIGEGLIFESLNLLSIEVVADAVFLKAVLIISDSADIRRVTSIYLKRKALPVGPQLTQALIEAVDEQGGLPRSAATKKSWAGSVADIFLRYAEGEYAEQLTFFFFPYLPEVPNETPIVESFRNANIEPGYWLQIQQEQSAEEGTPSPTGKQP